MEPKTNNESETEASNGDKSVSFPRVTAVVTGWTFDFMFLSLCRYFKKGKHNEFNATLSTLEAICQSPSLKGGLYDEKTMLCAFLARLMHGKELDVQFDEDESVMPLMSAAKIWSNLKETVADESLYENINILLLVQSVAVCLEKGQRSTASSALKWFENNHEIPQNVGVKLSTIVTQRETYHPILMNFNFNRLLETVQTFLDAYLEKNPSDYLLKAATKMVQLSQDTAGLEDSVTQDSSRAETDNESADDTKEKKKTACLGTKRKLMSTKMTDVWKPDTCKKAYVSVRRISQHELSQMKSEKSVDTLKIKNTSKLPPTELSHRTSEKSADTSTIQKTRKPPQKWTYQLDKYLKDGVRRHGQGRWSRILMDYDFEGRTGTMLKDRWRVLVRSHEVI